MAESTVNFLLDQLAILVQKNKELLGGLKQEVEVIQGELGHMKVFLRAADAKEESDPQLKEWVRQVREIAYDVEDVLDMYMIRFARPSTNGFNGHIRKVYSAVKDLKARHDIASEIQKIKYRVKGVSESQQRYKEMYAAMDQGLSSSHTAKTWHDGRSDALLLEETDVVGIERPKKQLVEWLLSTESGITVISVVGMGGLGKTTLVKKIYDDPSLKSNFNLHVWITVSESFNVEYLLLRIIKQLVKEVKQPPPEGLEVMNADEMREFVYKFLKHQTYIIVLDDIWKTYAWEAIKFAFPRSDSRGCVIITTRFNSIGNAICCENKGHLYNLEPLPAKEARQLFYRKAFQGNLCPLYLEDISESILKKCAGLPLAIVVIGGLLATKNNSLEKWQMFTLNLGDELEENRIMKLLALSYYDLPYYLKSCFLYFSIFREDELLGKYTLIRMWVAEGFVKPTIGKTMEEVAEGYLNELLNRSLIQVEAVSLDGSPQTFCIHDLLREYIISKSRELNVAVTSDGGEVSWPNKIRRLGVHSSYDYTQEYGNFKYLRTLLWTGSAGRGFIPVLNKTLSNGCRLLKVLDSRGAPLTAIPSEVFSLYHLKYLSLRGTKVQYIPESIKNLKNLETLDLVESNVTELPKEILKLHKLRHLFVCKLIGNAFAFHKIQSFNAPYNIGECLLSLQTLTCICADEVDGIKIVREIGKLTQMKCLGIMLLRREDGKELCSSLAKLTKLHSLFIYSIKEDEIIDLNYSLAPSSLQFLQTFDLHGCLEKVPQWLHSLYSLTELYLRWSGLNEDPLEAVQSLPNLAALCLDCAYEGVELHFRAGGFQKLKRLRLHSLRKLRCVRVEEGSMPFLEDLSFVNNKLMEEVPEGIEHLTNLQYMEFAEMGQEFVASLRDLRNKGGKHWKLSRVPRVHIYNMVDGQWQWQAL